jgi:hypothetical protein
LLLAKKSFTQNRTVCWRFVVKAKPTVDYLFFGAFPFDRIPKVTKDVNLHFFRHATIL